MANNRMVYIKIKQDVMTQNQNLVGFVSRFCIFCSRMKDNNISERNNNLWPNKTQAYISVYV